MSIVRLDVDLSFLAVGYVHVERRHRDPSVQQPKSRCAEMRKVRDVVTNDGISCPHQLDSLDEKMAG